MEPCYEFVVNKVFKLLLISALFYLNCC